MSDDDFFESKDIFLKKDDEIIGLHATGYMDENSQFQSMEAWLNVYDLNRKFLYSAARIFGDLEIEAEALEKDGWKIIQ